MNQSYIYDQILKNIASKSKNNSYEILNINLKDTFDEFPYNDIDY